MSFSRCHYVLTLPYSKPPVGFLQLSKPIQFQNIKCMFVTDIQYVIVIFSKRQFNLSLCLHLQFPLNDNPIDDTTIPNIHYPIQVPLWKLFGIVSSHIRAFTTSIVKLISLLALMKPPYFRNLMVLPKKIAFNKLFLDLWNFVSPPSFLFKTNP